MLKETIRKLRKARGLTQKEVAEQIGVTAPSVTYWEGGGGIDLPNLQKLAKVLGVPAKTLIEEAEKESSPQKNQMEPQFLQDSYTSLGNNTSARKRTQQAEEATTMRGDDGLNAILGDLMKRITRLEDKIFTIEKDEVPTKLDPPHRRKG